MTNLTIAKVKKQSKEFDKTEKYEITDGVYKGSIITFYPTFSDTKIEELLTELQSIQKEIVDNKLDISEKMNVYIIQFLIIKHFTHFKNAIPSSLLPNDKNESLLDYLEHFQKTGLFKLILDNVFLPTEIQKVFESLTDFVSKALVHIDLEKQLQDKVSNLKFKYKDAFDQIDELDNDNIENVLVDE